jgi:hypothetical protein
MNMLQLYINGLEVDLPVGFTLPMSYSVNEIGDIATRESALSTTVELPSTARNSRIFAGNAYKVLPCQIREIGTPITNGTVEVESITETINIRIEAGNASFYRNLEGVNIRDLAFYQSYDHAYSLASVAASQLHSWKDVYAYAACNPGTIAGRDMEAGLSLIEMFPALFVKKLFVDLIGYLGYYATGEFLEDTLFSSCLIDNGKPFRYSSEQLDGFRVVAGISPDASISASDNSLSSTDVFEGYLNFNFTGEAFGYGFSDKGGNFDTLTSAYTAPADMYMKAKVQLPFRGRIDGVFATVLIEAQLEINGVVVQKNGTEYPGRFLGSLGPRRYKLHTSEFATVQVKQGDLVRFRYLIKKTAAVTDYDIQVLLGLDSQLTIEAEPFILPGSTVSVNSLLPDMEAKDFLLSLANQFCLLFIVNERKKEVRIERFQKVIANIPKAQDWSAKVDFSEPPEETFESENYGQKSVFAYAETEGYTGDGLLTLFNQKLEKEKTVFESKIAASPLVDSFTGLQLLGIRRYSVAENVRFGPWFAAGTYQNSPGLDYVVYEGRYFKSKVNENANNPPLVPHRFIQRLFVVSSRWEEVGVVELLEKLGENDAGVRMFHARQSEPISVNWEDESINVNQMASFELLNFPALLSTYYAGLGTALYAVRYLKMLLRLNASDIRHLDFTLPKYIYSNHVRFGQIVSGYWYVSSVEQYKHGAYESCYVNLVRVVPTWQNELRKAAVASERNVLGTQLDEAFETSGGDFISAD